MGYARARARVRVLVTLAVLTGCGSQDERFPRDEARLRERLGVPADAERVIVVSQSSHLDLNFLFTFDAYWSEDVRFVLRAALDLLDREPRYRYSIAEVGWLRRYWDEVPEDRERLLAHVRSGAFRVVGGGLSSPDTILPTGESLLRDWMLGMRWVEGTLGARPTAAWQPDSFGHGATLPTLLEHLGLGAVAFFRVDGGLSFASAEAPSPVVLPDGTAALLADLGTADVVWRADDGAEVLVRWLPFGYGHGDTLDSPPAIVLSGIGFDFNRPELVDASTTNEQLERFIASLEPYRRTPYLFLPIGIDFSYPKPNLLAYLDRWNRERYPETGVWAVAATFEEYAALAGAHRDELPALELDVNPYWTGFYSQQPHLKRDLRRAHEALTAAEKAGVVAALAGAPYPAPALATGWDRSAFMNHHDGITGTAGRQVLRTDHVPWTDLALASGELALADALAGLSEHVETASFAALGAERAIVVFNPASWTRAGVVTVPASALAPANGPAASATGSDRSRRDPMLATTTTTTTTGAPLPHASGDVAGGGDAMVQRLASPLATEDGSRLPHRTVADGGTLVRAPDDGSPGSRPRARGALDEGGDATPSHATFAVVTEDGSTLPHQVLADGDVLVFVPEIGSVGHLTLGVGAGIGAGEASTPLPGLPAEPSITLAAGGAPVADAGAADTVVLANDRLRVTLERAHGFAVTSVRTADGRELLAGSSNELVTYRDLGGAYRIGAELGDSWRPVARSTEEAARIEVLETGPVRVAVRVSSDDSPGREQIVRLERGAARVDFETTLATATATSTTVRFATRFPGSTVTTSVPFGAVERPREKLFDPTFWPVTAWLDLASPDGAGGLLLSSVGTRGASARPDGSVELLIARNAVWDFLGPVGLDPETHTSEYALAARDGASWTDDQSDRRGLEPARRLVAAVTDPHPGSLPSRRSWLAVDSPRVELSAVKLAEDGSGDVIVRLVRRGPFEPERVTVTTSLPDLHEAWTANGLEEPLTPLPGDPSAISLTLDRNLTTLRLQRTSR